MQDSPAASISRLKFMIDDINAKKRSLLRALTLSMNHYQKYQRKQFIDSLSSCASDYSQSATRGKPKLEYQVKRFCSKKTLDIGKNLLKADPENLSPENYLWRQMKKRGLLSLPKLHQEFQARYSKLNVLPKYFRVRETLKAMFLCLENDIQFIQRLRTFEDDGESFKYLRDKLKIELDASHINFDMNETVKPLHVEIIDDSEVQVIEADTKTQCSSKSNRQNFELNYNDEFENQIFKRRKIDQLRDVPLTFTEEQKDEDSFCMEITPVQQMSPLQSRRTVRVIARSDGCSLDRPYIAKILSYFSKEYLMKACKHLFTALILYHGIQYFLGNASGFNQISGNEEQSFAVIDRTLTLSDSKRRLLPALLEAYSNRCIQNTNNSSSSIVSWAVMSSIAVKSHKIVSAMSLLIEKFIRQLFTRGIAQ